MSAGRLLGVYFVQLCIDGDCGGGGGFWKLVAAVGWLLWESAARRVQEREMGGFSEVELVRVEFGVWIVLLVKSWISCKKQIVIIFPLVIAVG